MSHENYRRFFLSGIQDEFRKFVDATDDYLGALSVPRDEAELAHPRGKECPSVLTVRLVSRREQTGLTVG